MKKPQKHDPVFPLEPDPDAVDAVNYASPPVPAPATEVPSYPGGPNYPVDPNYPASPFGAPATLAPQAPLAPPAPAAPIPPILAILNGTKITYNVVGDPDPTHPDRYLRGPDFKQAQIQIGDRIVVLDPSVVLDEFICLSEGTANDAHWLKVGGGGGGI